MIDIKMNYKLTLQSFRLSIHIFYDNVINVFTNGFLTYSVIDITCSKHLTVSAWKY